MSKYYREPYPIPHAKKSYIKIYTRTGTADLVIMPDNPAVYIQAHADFTLPNGDDNK